MTPVNEFQKKYFLTPDGIIGKKTFEKMLNVWSLKPLQLVHFLAQTDHETAGFKYRYENLNYSATALTLTFPKHFPNLTSALDYAGKPSMIANRVYADRFGNGNTQSGDGYKYRGRGSIQTTFKDNYYALSVFVKDSTILKDPDKVADDYFWDSGLFYFKNRKIWYICNDTTLETITKVTKLVNGGTNGLQDRINLTKKYEKLI